jgi:hypothetical protein
MEINYICSLGPVCHSANIIKDLGLKICSYPFDWIFSNHDLILECINDKFNCFLNRSFYCEYIQKWNDRQCGHIKYGLNMFNHKDPRNNDDYNYYIKCVNRFLNLLDKKEHKLFILTYINISNIDEEFKKNIIEFNDKFSKYITNHTLLVIFNIPNKETNFHKFTYNDNIHFLELHTQSQSVGSSFVNDDDNKYLNSIIKETYNFNIKKIDS